MELVALAAVGVVVVLGVVVLNRMLKQPERDVEYEDITP